VYDATPELATLQKNKSAFGVRVRTRESTVRSLCLPPHPVVGRADRASDRAETIGRQNYPIGGRADSKNVPADPTRGESYRTSGQKDAVGAEKYRAGGQNYAKVAGIIAWGCSMRP